MTQANLDHNLNILLAYRDYPLSDLPEDIQECYRQVQQAIEDHEDVNRIVRRWKKYQDRIQPNTVAAHIRGALVQQRYWDEFVECHPNHLSLTCTRKIINCQRQHGRYHFTLVREGDNPTIIYLDEDNGIFDGFSVSEKQLLSDLGCTDVYLVSFKTSTGKYFKIYPYTVPVDEVRTRSSNIPTNDYNYGHVYFGLMILILFLILIYWLFFRREQSDQLLSPQDPLLMSPAASFSPF